MGELRGVGIGTGIAVGRVRRMADPIEMPTQSDRVDSAEVEFVKAQGALRAVNEELSTRARGATGDAVAILEAQALMSIDPALLSNVQTKITDGMSAERAVFTACEEFERILVSMGGYLAERASDVADIASRAIAVLRGVEPPSIPVSDEPFVLVAHDLAPADTLDLDASRVLGIVTREGGPTSHTAIIARAKSIPAVVGVAGAENLVDGTHVIVDASASIVVTDVTDVQVADALARRSEWSQRSQDPPGPGELRDGHRIALMANVGSREDAELARAFGAEGIGLLRTELLFMNVASSPTFDEQLQHYRAIFEEFQGRRVVARTLDAGSDKPMAFLSSSAEPNPSLGLRGLRAMREHEDILRTQLRALVSAASSTGADLWVMAPMVSDAADAEFFVSLARDAGAAIAGVMAEVPALVFVADQVTDVVDFVSIGTNDLTQYTMAADRMLASVSSWQDPWHPAVLRAIALIAKAGVESNTPVGVCGEAAADPSLAIVLVGLGVTSLSMSSAVIPEVRRALASVTLDEARAKAERAVSARSAHQAREVSG